MPSPMENRAIVFGPSRRPLEKTGSDRVTLSSLDRDFRLPVRPFVDLTLNAAYIAAICNTGAYVSLDHVGRDLDGRDHERVSMIKELVEIGVGDRLCLAGDMGKKEYWPAYGGKPGLAYILTDLKKELTACIGEEAFDAMVRANPQRLLNWA